jgi:hypothetical protein
MSTVAETFIEALGGLPFVAPAFRAQLLLSVVAGVRRRYDPAAHNLLAEYLEPHNARNLFIRFGRSQIEEPPTVKLKATELRQIRKARSQVLTVRPDWEELLNVPVCYRKLADNRVSVTSALIPQVIFLGEPAFTTLGILAEVLVHEHAHIWLNFLAETSDLQTADATEVYRLPSGTGGKTVRGVLLAAHFAASAHAFHVRCSSGGNRALFLHRYLNGCLDLLCSSNDLSDMGHCVQTSLRRYSVNSAESIGPAEI